MTRSLALLHRWQVYSHDKTNCSDSTKQCWHCRKATLDRNFTDATCSYSDACCCNDQAIGLIMTKVKPSEYKDLENKSAKEVWDTLKMWHADTHTGVAAFFIKVGMLQKKYNDGDDMNTHLTFFTMENQKLGTNAFDDEFLMQLMLMSLPQDNINWNIVTIILLQATSETKKLSTTDVTTRLMQEYSRLTGSESTDSALAAHAGKSKQTSKSGKWCTYKPCHKKGHTEDECRMKKRDQGKQDSGNSREKKKEKRAIANIAEDETVSKSASLAAIFKSSLPSDEEGEVHLFIASDVIAFISHESSHDTFIDSGCSCHLSPRCEYFIDETFTILKKHSSWRCINHPGHWKRLTALSHGYSQGHCPCHHH